jgi:transmembrane protein EpsG
MIPFYWLSQIKVTQKKLWVYLVAIMGSFVLRNQLLAFLQYIVGYEAYQQYEGAAAGTFMFLLMAMVIYVAVFWERISLSDNQVINMSINALMIAAFFSPLLLINPSMMRVVQYYSIFMLFIIPDLSLVFDKKSQNLFLLIISSVMIILLLIQRPRYSFFFM